MRLVLTLIATAATMVAVVLVVWPGPEQVWVKKLEKMPAWKSASQREFATVEREIVPLFNAIAEMPLPQVRAIWKAYLPTHDQGTLRYKLFYLLPEKFRFWCQDQIKSIKGKGKKDSHIRETDMHLFNTYYFNLPFSDGSVTGADRVGGFLARSEAQRAAIGTCGASWPWGIRPDGTLYLCGQYGGYQGPGINITDFDHLAKRYGVRPRFARPHSPVNGPPVNQERLQFLTSLPHWSSISETNLPAQGRALLAGLGSLCDMSPDELRRVVAAYIEVPTNGLSPTERHSYTVGRQGNVFLLNRLYFDVPGTTFGAMSNGILQTNLAVGPVVLVQGGEAFLRGTKRSSSGHGFHSLEEFDDFVKLYKPRHQAR